jgi:uncharacterized membrane protein (DUF373 family)
VTKDDSTAGDDQPIEHWVERAASSFLWLEHAAYVALGALLCLTAILALAGTCALLWSSLASWTGDETVLHVIDRLLFVLMVVEILHTVRASMRTGGLVCEPFLVVGLIASIRRVLVITLRSSETTKQNEMSDAAEKLFHASMQELMVLALLIIVMVIAMFILQRNRATTPN